MTFAWLKGHGTENDFVLLPDHDGRRHGVLDPDFVAALCHRRRGIGADGVLRVVRSSAIDVASDAEWFMDYRNADGSLSEMCGNGLRVFARHLIDEGLVAPEPSDPGGVRRFVVGTRDGDKIVEVRVDGRIAVDLGPHRLGGVSKVVVGGQVHEVRAVDTGNPHAVAEVADLAEAGPLLQAPVVDAEVYPQGANVEFVVRRGVEHVAMRVHERGSGETQSCGTGAGAVAAVVAHADQAPLPATYRVDVPGGRLDVTVRADGHLILAGPAEIVARGEMDWIGEGGLA